MPVQYSKSTRVIGLWSIDVSISPFAVSSFAAHESKVIVLFCWNRLHTSLPDLICTDLNEVAELTDLRTKLLHLSCFLDTAMDVCTTEFILEGDFDTMTEFQFLPRVTAKFDTAVAESTKSKLLYQI